MKQQIANITEDELVIILDGLSMLPLSRSYNLFNKLMAQMKAQTNPDPQQSFMDEEDMNHRAGSPPLPS